MWLSPLMDNIIDNYCLTRMDYSNQLYLIMTDLPRLLVLNQKRGAFLFYVTRRQ
jgi:hypothetical protein